MASKSITIAIVSDDPEMRVSIARELGKKSSEEDVAFYHAKNPDSLITVLDCVKFPEKVQSLLYVLGISDYCVLGIKALNAQIGEAIVAIDSAGIKAGCIFTSLYQEQIAPFLKGTALEGWKIVGNPQEARAAALSFQVSPREGQLKGIIDHSFEVKGVGSVALGFVSRGTLRVHDKLEVFPSGKKLEVRSIQMQDDDYDSASAGDRFGISFKGIKAEELSKGDVIAPEKALGVFGEIEMDVSLSKFCKRELKDSEVVHLSIGLQFVPCKYVGQSILPGQSGRGKFVFEKPVAFDKGTDRAVLVRLNEKPLRVSGFGK